MISPVTAKPNVKLVTQIDAEFVIEKYRKELDVDVSKYFKGIAQIGLYECEDTGYRFYMPDSLAGGAELYETLQLIPWYYSAGKVEHVQAKEKILAGSSLLEVGCGSGIFLDSIKDMDVNVTGIEFNSAAVEKARAKGLWVVLE
jgi:2-polyprenyl-3-methyl-5-hydroxy-6-metoxy-1,4-benzoquinol methylase